MGGRRKEGGGANGGGGERRRRQKKINKTLPAVLHSTLLKAEVWKSRKHDRVSAATLIKCLTP